MGNSAPVRTATEFEVATLYRIRSLLEDNSSKSIKALLKRLWNAVMPLDYTFALPSPHWYLIGFQVTDPRISYKGGGCLALQQLVFFAERFPSTFIHFVNQVSYIIYIYICLRIAIIVLI
jgi:ELMO domain-containing protein